MGLKKRPGRTVLPGPGPPSPAASWRGAGDASCLCRGPPLEPAVPRNPGRTRCLGAPQTDAQLSGTLRKSPADGRGGLLARPHTGSEMCSALMRRASPGLVLLKSPLDLGGLASAGGHAGAEECFVPSFGVAGKGKKCSCLPFWREINPSKHKRISSFRVIFTFKCSHLSSYSFIYCCFP